MSTERRSSLSLTNPVSPPTQTERSSSATAAPPSCNRPHRDPAQPATHAARRPRGDRPARRDRARRRARRRHAADHAGRPSTRSTRRTAGTPGSRPAPSRRRRRPPGPLWWCVVGRRVPRATDRTRRRGGDTRDAPVPPGIPRLPGPGEYYASPALRALLEPSPPAELADRYPGREVGTIADSALPSADSLIIVIGRSPQRAGARSACVAGVCNQHDDAEQL